MPTIVMVMQLVVTSMEYTCACAAQGTVGTERIAQISMNVSQTLTIATQMQHAQTRRGPLFALVTLGT